VLDIGYSDVFRVGASGENMKLHCKVKTMRMNMVVVESYTIDGRLQNSVTLLAGSG